MSSISSKPRVQSVCLTASNNNVVSAGKLITSVSLSPAVQTAFQQISQSLPVVTANSIQSVSTRREETKLRQQQVMAEVAKYNLQQMVLKEWVPNIAFIDEITEALPLERSDFDGDSGASRAVTAALLTALSDETRRGQSLLIATTNCPWRMGAAMRSRFTVIPVLHPLQEDFLGIITATAHRITPYTKVSDTDPHIVKAAEIFYHKGANPREIRAALSNALMLHGSLTPDTVLFAAQDINNSCDLISVIYADLWAIKACSSLSFFPWSVPDYPFPPHLQGIVDPDSKEINQTELDKQIEQLRPHANL